MAEMEIKEIEEEDFSEVIELIKAEFPYVSFDKQKVKERIKKRNIFLFKAVESKILLGFIEVELMESIARINGLTVKPDYRNKGVARKLLDFGLAFLKKKKIERVLLLVKEKNEAAKKLYMQAGFKFIGMYHRELDQAVVEEMELDLAKGNDEDLSYVG